MEGKYVRKVFNVLIIFGLVTILLSCKGVGNMPGNTFDKLIIKSSAFENNGYIPEKYTGRGEDISPKINIDGIASNAKSIAIIMDDLDNPLIKDFNHWIIWNIPVQEIIPENIQYGEIVETLDGAVQGIAYGKHKYKGPKPPRFFGNAHRYQFSVYVLDCMLELDGNSKKRELVKAMNGHIIQFGSIIGLYKNN
jgi:Raf kinase inhibitor-like YbhB/YbcL family protein